MTNVKHILVDYQNDFAHAQWALSVPGWDKILNAINELMQTLADKWIETLASKDRHPTWHISFASTHNEAPFTPTQDGSTLLWPDHCVQNTRGAEYFDGLQTDYIKQLIQKATTQTQDSYSAFGWTDLDQILTQENREIVVISWLATDYCIKATALDAVKNGYKTYVVTDAIAWVNPETTQQAIQEMQKQWITLVTKEDLLNIL